jgi:RND family efflux transporter MFP subunit
MQCAEVASTVMIASFGREMSRRRTQPPVLLPLLMLCLAVTACFRNSGETTDAEASERRVAAVEVAQIERRALDLERTFSGALEAKSEFVVAPKVPGRVESIEVDLGDIVSRGQIVARLDEAEFAQAVRQAEAELAVAEANHGQAVNALEISRRENQRIMTLREGGIASSSEYDVAQADLLQKEAEKAIAEAEVTRATAALESARIRHGYTRITADWNEGDSRRIVAERYVDEGETVSANNPLLLIVQLDPVVAVISVTERDYGHLQPGFVARFETDAFPREVFEGRITRIAPVFRETSRQARVELTVGNTDHRLKPGMFIRATITLDQVEDAVALPEAALTQRAGKDGVFVVNESGDTVSWVPVETGIRSRGWVHIPKPPLAGRVVTLGQHLLDDGSPITIAATFEPEAER